MSQVWPPPPKVQPETTVPVPSLHRRLAAIISSGLLYSCLGVLMLLFTALISVSLHFLKFARVPESALGTLILLSPILLIVGGSLGYAQRRTANSLAALVVSAAAFCLGCGLVLIRLL